MSMQHKLNPIQQKPQPSASANRWLTHYLESRVFLRLPAKNLQSLITQLEEVQVQANTTLITPNSPADYYYIIKQGTLDMFHDQQHVTTLSEGEGFGEEVLSNNPRYSLKVSAATDCTLMRLSRENFDQLLVSPVLQTVSAQDGITNKNLIDTNPSNLHESHQSQHIPFHKLRTQLSSLNKKTDYIVTHQDAGLRKASAFTLSQLGYSVSVMDGEISAPSTATTLDENFTNEEIDPSLFAELEELDAQIKSLGSFDQEQLPPSSNEVGQKNNQIACVESDEEQLWTPIPTAANMPSDNLRVLKTQEEATPLLRNSPKTHNTTTSSVETESWLEDNYVWEKILGFDGTDNVDELLQQEHQKTTDSLEQQTSKHKANPFLLTPSSNTQSKQDLHTSSTTAQTIKEQVEKHRPKTKKSHNKGFYAVAVILAISLIAWPKSPPCGFTGRFSFNNYQR